MVPAHPGVRMPGEINGPIPPASPVRPLLHQRPEHRFQSEVSAPGLPGRGRRSKACICLGCANAHARLDGNHLDMMGSAGGVVDSSIPAPSFPRAK